MNTQQQQQFVKVGQLVQGRGNPRRFFDQAQMDELAASIRSNGLMQPLLVRRIEDGQFQIIAGERRWRACKDVYGDDGEIPVVIRDCGDEEADVLALVENTVRADMSPTEEAEAAHRILTRLKGDRDEAAGMLGWTVAKLNRRVALMRLTEKVRNALTERAIQLGHAELIAALPPDKQDAVLDKVIAHNVPVAQVKAQLGKMASALADAVFDKTECDSCPYSSSSQHALFTEALADGFCTRPSCYQDKTEKHLESVAATLKDEVPRVEIVRPGDVVTAIKLVAEGNVGVGVEQAKACRSCANFGSTVSAVPGSVGQVEQSICFDAECNTTKVAANLKAQTQASAAANKARSEVRAKGGTKEAAEKAASTAAATVKKAASAPTTKGPSSRVIEYRLNAWRKIAARVMFADPQKSKAVLVSLAVNSMSSRIESSKVAEVMTKFTGTTLPALTRHSIDGGATTALEAGEAVLDTLVTALAPSAMKGLTEHEIKPVLKFLAVDMAAHWKLDTEFLDLLTKSEIDALVAELGIDKALGDKALAKARTGKKDEFIKAVLGAESFDYANAVPRVMQYALADETANTAPMPFAAESQGDGAGDDEGTADDDAADDTANEDEDDEAA